MYSYIAIVHDFTDLLKVFDLNGPSVLVDHMTRLPGFILPKFMDYFTQRYLAIYAMQAGHIIRQTHKKEASK